MNFGKFDAMILLTMSLAVISMSFVFPAIGLTTQENVADSEIPELDVQTDRFDIAGGFPSAPETARKGTLEWDQSESTQLWNNRVLPAQGYELLMTEFNSDPKEVDIRLNEYDSNGNPIGNTTVTLGNGTTKTGIIQGDVGARIELVESNDPYYKVEYTITDRPDDDQGIIGSVFDTANATAQTLYWFGEIIFWFFLTLFDFSLNAITGLTSVTVFLFNLIGFLTSTYTAIISSAQGFASVFVAIPGVILTIILSKALIIGIKLLPTT